MVKVTHQPATVIENVTNFCYFCNALMLQSLWNEIFVEFGDKRLLSCTPVADIRLACIHSSGDQQTLFFMPMEIFTVLLFPITLSSRPAAIITMMNR